MKVTVLQENIFPKIQEAVRFVSTKPQLPILSGIFLSAQEGQVTVRSTDLKVGFQSRVGGKIESDGECVVPAKYFSELLASLNPGPLQLLLEQDSLQIIQGNMRSKLSTFPTVDFPPFPNEGEEITDFSVAEFYQAIDQTYYAASLDETRPVLASLSLSFDENLCQVAATDGYRLALTAFPILTRVEKKMTVLIKAKMLSEIARIINKKPQGKVRFCVAQELQQAIFHTEDTTMMISLTEGAFPPYDQIIPTSFALQTTTAREPLIHALKTALVLAKESSSIVTLTVRPKKLLIQGLGVGVGENETELESTYDGKEEKKIACNAKFLLDCLQRMEGKSDVELSVNEELKPVRFRPVGDETFTYIVMPFKK